MSATEEPTRQPPERVTPADLRARFGTGMVRRFGWFYRALGLSFAMARVRMEEHAVHRIRDAAQKGPLVYVLLHRSTLDLVALNAVLNRRRLPLAAWANGGAVFTWQPVATAWRELLRRVRRWWLQGRNDAIKDGYVTRAVADGTPVAVFLLNAQGERDPGADPLQALVEAQALSGKPIQLVPMLPVWDRKPESGATAVRDFLLGARERPSLLARLTALYLPSNRTPFIQAGVPVDLAQLCERVPADRRSATLHTLLRRYLTRESRTVRGPALLPRSTMRKVVLDNPPMRDFAVQHAARSGQALPAVQRQLHREFDAIAANFSWGVIRFFSWALRPVWSRVYSGYDIRPEDLDRIRTAMRDGAVVLAPCHKSHFDYLLISWVLYHDDLIPPHVIAGMNLAIWPVSLLLRGAGGFFIRRSFQGQEVHAAVFERYLRELLQRGYPVEFFIEGGRTRSGLLLPPKLGALSMMLDAASHHREGHEITILPMAISYEQVAEEGAYQSEAHGVEKRRETLGQLLRARSVLRRRFGKAYLRVGEPLNARNITGSAADWQALPEPERRGVIRRTGERIVHRIGAAMIVLPTSLVALGLLTHDRQAIEQGALLERLHRWHALLTHRGLHAADALNRFDAAITQALDRFTQQGHIRPLRAEGRRIWDVLPERRILLDFHKNQILHGMVEAGMAATAVRALPSGTFAASDLLGTIAFLEAALTEEFTFEPDVSCEQRLQAGLADLEVHGAIEAQDGAFRVVDRARLDELHRALLPLLEAYHHLGRQAATLLDRKQPTKAFLAAAAEAGNVALRTGEVTRPEALSHIHLKHALRTGRDIGMIETSEDGQITANADALSDFLSTLGPLVRP